MLRGNRRGLKLLIERALAAANSENILRGHEGNNDEPQQYILESIPSPSRISLNLGMPPLIRVSGRGTENLQNSPANEDQTPQYFNSLLNNISTRRRLSGSFSSPNRPSSDGEGPHRKKRNKRKGKQTTRRNKGKKNKKKKRR